MKSKSFFPQDQVFWYLKRNGNQPLRESLDVDVVVIGGGIAGLSAAQSFAQRGKSVVLLEQYYCGGGASGKSAGIVTPDAELTFSDFIARYGFAKAVEVWNFIIAGLQFIESNIKTHNLACDYQRHDGILLANSNRLIKEVKNEYENLKKAGQQAIFFTKDELKKIINSDGYSCGVSYPGSFGIDVYSYCQEMKTILQKSGVKIFEESPVIEINDGSVRTPHATVKARHIVVCADCDTPNLNILKQEVYHAQTFLLASQPLTNEQVRSIFPDKNYMVWDDTDLDCNYFRLTENNRLLLGGGSILTTYLNELHDSTYIFKKLTNYFHHKFPHIDVNFEYQWPGLHGISKDISPIFGQDKTMPSVYYATAAAGLPIAAALGMYSAEHILDKRTTFDEIFSPYRKFPIGGLFQRIIGNRLSFALSNFLKKNIP